MIPKNDFFVIFSFAACLVALLCAVVLVSFSRSNRLPNRLLALGLIGLGTIVFTNTLNYTDIFMRFPHLFRATFPIHYAIPPIFYLYVRSALFNENKFRKYDWILFLPSVLHLLEFMPYYMLSANDKIEMLENLYENPSTLADHSQGLLPPFMHPLIKSLYGLGCTFFSFKLLYRNKEHLKTKGSAKRKIWIWTHLLTWQLGLFYVMTFLVFCFHGRLPNLIDFVNTPIMLVLFTSALTLLYKPSVLYGIHFDRMFQSSVLAERSTKPKKEIEKKFSLTEEQMCDYEQKITSFFEEKRPFLKQNYKIKQLSEDIGIPIHHLSLFINEKYNISYSNFINRARIDHIVTIFDNEKSKQLTLEGLAKESGFNSRNTFIRAFKKYLGQTPSEYFHF